MRFRKISSEVVSEKWFQATNLGWSHGGARKRPLVATRWAVIDDGEEIGEVWSEISSSYWHAEKLFWHWTGIRDPEDAADTRAMAAHLLRMTLLGNY